MRRLLKKAWSWPPFRLSSTPGVTSSRWLVSGERRTSKAPPSAPPLGSRRAVNQPLDARGDDRAGAHDARLLGDVERRVRETPRAQRRAASRTSRISACAVGSLRELLLVLCLEHEVAADEDRADRHVAGAARPRRRARARGAVAFVVDASWHHASTVRMRARRDSNPRSQPSEGCALSSYATGAREAVSVRVGRRPGARDVLEQVELVVDERAVKLTHAIGMTEKVRPRVREIFARAIRHVMRDLDLFHLAAIDRMRAEIARNRGHEMLPRDESRPPSFGGRPFPFWLG